MIILFGEISFLQAHIGIYCEPQANTLEGKVLPTLMPITLLNDLNVAASSASIALNEWQ